MGGVFLNFSFFIIGDFFLIGFYLWW